MAQNTYTVNFMGIEMEVTGIYSPEEPMVMYYKDGSGYPGSASEFEVTEVKIGNVNVDNLIEKLDAYNDLAELVIKQIEE